MLGQDNVNVIPARAVEEWTRQIAAYVEKYKDNMIARQVLPVRKVADSTAIDVATEYNRSGPGAIVCAKGTIPDSTIGTMTYTKHDVYQILAGFDYHERDLQQDSKLKSRNVDICMRSIHRTEDDFILNGSTTLNVTGITTAVQSANTIAAGSNHGAWDNSEANDIHADMVDLINLVDTDFEPAWVLGNPTDINKLNNLDSERQPYWKTIIDLFQGAREKKDFLYKSGHITAGTIYIGPKDPMAAEIVVAENPKVTTLPIQRGRVYPVELAEWLTVEIHEKDAFAKIATT